MNSNAIILILTLATIFAFILGFLIGWVCYWRRIQIDKLRKRIIKKQKISPH